MRSSCSLELEKLCIPSKMAHPFHTLTALSASYFAFVGMLAHSSSRLYSLRGSIYTCLIVVEVEVEVEVTDDDGNEDLNLINLCFLCSNSAPECSQISSDEGSKICELV